MSTNPSDHEQPASGEEGLLPFDFHEILHTARKQKWLILGVTLAMATLAVFWTLRQPKVFEAVCILEYDPDPARPLGAGIEDVANPISNFWAAKEFYTTQNSVLQSRSLAERVVRSLSLHQNAGFMGISAEMQDGWEGVPPDRAARRLQSMVSVEQQQDSRMVEVRIRDRNPERAALLVNTLAREYLDDSREERLGVTRSALTWLEEQLDNLEGELQNTEHELHGFKASNDILSISLEDRQNIVSNRIVRLSQALTDMEAKRIELNARLQRLREANRDNPLDAHATLIANDPAIQELRSRHRERSSQREALSRRYGENHPTIQQLDAELSQIISDMRLAIGGLISAVERDLGEVRATEAGLRSSLQGAQSRGLELNELEIGYTQLSRQRDNRENLVKMLLERSAETNLNRLSNVDNARIVDDALVPGAPVSPRMSINVMLGLVGGLILGLLLAMARMRMDRTLRSVEDAEALGITILGVLPGIDSDGAKSPKYGPKRMPRSVPSSASKDLIVHDEPRSAIAECCRSIRTNITFMSPDEQLRAIVVTSPRPREGKTTVAVSLAISMAQSGKRVLLADTDLRRPRVHSVFGIGNGRGITTVLVGGLDLSEAVYESKVPGLSVLPAGPIPPNPAELLQSQAFPQVVERAKELYDVVIFDSPPVTAVTDAVIIAPRLAGAIVVARAGGTTRDALRSVLRQLHAVGANVIGGVLNDVDLSERPYRSGGYYYYRSEGYYGTQDDEDSGEFPTSTAAE